MHITIVKTPRNEHRNMDMPDDEHVNLMKCRDNEVYDEYEKPAA